MRWLLSSALLSASLAHAASVLLVPVDERARALAEELVEPFGAQQLTVKTAGAGSPAVNCLKAKDRVPCLTALGEKAKVMAVFVVSGALKGPKGVLTLELIADGKVLKKDSTKVTKGKVKAQMRGPVERLLALVPRPADAPPAQPPAQATVTDTPKAPVAEVPPAQPQPQPEPTLTPAPRPPEDPLALKRAPPPAPRPKTAAWVMTGLAVAAAGTAATFGGLGLANKSQLESAPEGVSALSYSQATQLQQTSNTQLTVALGTGIGAGVAGVVAAILWGVE